MKTFRIELTNGGIRTIKADKMESNGLMINFYIKDIMQGHTYFDLKFTYSLLNIRSVEAVYAS